MGNPLFLLWAPHARQSVWFYPSFPLFEAVSGEYRPNHFKLIHRMIQFHYLCFIDEQIDEEGTFKLLNSVVFLGNSPVMSYRSGARTSTELLQHAKCCGLLVSMFIGHLVQCLRHSHLPDTRARQEDAELQGEQRHERRSRR